MAYRVRVCYAAVMAIRILYLGDLVGAAGWQMVKQALPALRQTHRADLIIANAENAANGTGLTPEIYHKLNDAGVDGITLGDHVFKKQQIVSILESRDNIVRPANMSARASGKRWMRLTIQRDHAPAVDVYILLLLGRLFMTLPANDPFDAADQLLGELPATNPIVIVEMHAEATSEKVAMGWHLNGRVAAVVGSHTHVATADARVLPADVPGGGGGGTGYITDVGMCGPHDSVLGRRVDRVLKHMTTGMHAAFDVAEGNVQINGVLLEIDERRRCCTHIEHVRYCGQAG